MTQHPVYRFDDFFVDPDSWKLGRDGDEVHVEPVVLKLLIYLIENRDRLVTRDELMDTVWGDTVISEAALSKAVARLRKALDDDSAAPRYLETVHSQGFRFVADVEEAERADHTHSSGETIPASVIRRRWTIRFIALVILVLLAAFWTRAPEQDVLREDDIRSLAVLPLDNLTGDPGKDFYVDGLHEILITELAQVRGLRVTSRQSTKRYRESQLSATEIATELGVDALVEGSLLRDGSKIELSIQLIDGRSDEHLWAERYAREMPYVFDLIADVATSIATEISSPAGSPGLEWPVDGLVGPIDPRAVDAYSLGITHMDRFTEDGIRTAIMNFQEAARIEPGFALAWGNLAVAHAMYALQGFAPPRESIEKARLAASKAIEADDQFYIGHSTLGWVRLWTGDLDGACESFEEALRLNPSAPYAMHGEADCLLLEGRMDESVSRTRELLLVGPYSSMHNRPLPFHLFLARRYEEAVSAALAAQVRAPGFPMNSILARVYWAQGEQLKALEKERRQLELQGDTELLATLEGGLNASGPVGALRAMAEALVRRAETSYVDPFIIGETFARAGAVDEALLWLDRAVEFGSFETTYIAFRPDFDVLRDDSRFQGLMDRVYRQSLPISLRP